MLKDRSGRSFDALGRRAGISGSSLHRYCAGTSVPPDSDAVLAFARVCGATRDEMRELNRLWALAGARRDTPRTVAAEVTPEPALATPTNGSTPGATTVTSSDMDTGPEGVPDRNAVAGGADDPDPPELFTRTRVGRPRTRRAVLIAVGAALILLSGTVWITRASGDASPATTTGVDDQMLFSPACGQVVSMGQTDECVTEVQNLLADAGGQLAVDGMFGPETLRRVTAFQVLAGLPPRGVVDDETKVALYEQQVSMETWPAEQVERRIREVFVEDPDRATAIADCQSFLDPLHVLPNTNGTRNWGVFQISDTRLREFDGTPRQAFDPEWNIQAAHQLWSVHHDFRDWPACDRAVSRESSESANPAAMEEGAGQ